jgi:hypothetical protein
MVPGIGRAYGDPRLTGVLFLSFLCPCRLLLVPIGMGEVHLACGTFQQPSSH